MSFSTWRMKRIVSPGHYSLEMDETGDSSQESRLPYSNGRANLKNLVASKCPIRLHREASNFSPQLGQ
jgi:hypothetical protein